MVSSVSSFDPVAYLSQIKGTAPAAPASNASASSSNTSTNAATSTVSTAPTATNPLGLSSALISLLQNVSSSSANGDSLASLIGSSSTTSSDPLAGVYNTLLEQASSAQPLQEAIAASQQLQSQASANNSPVQKVLASYTSSINAYNNTLLQNAKSVLSANSTPITA